ncbi:MAG: hypothetical protein KGL35_32690 [Bradyrhizobium sp.]|nr:hypothetical protein [Pseudomonadota bacterium]MDE2473339.1 hypothetical protein [Bradyrhizobium sp.]
MSGYQDQERPLGRLMKTIDGFTSGSLLGESLLGEKHRKSRRLTMSLSWGWLRLGAAKIGGVCLRRLGLRD